MFARIHALQTPLLLSLALSACGSRDVSAPARPAQRTAEPAETSVAASLPPEHGIGELPAAPERAPRSIAAAQNDVWWPEPRTEGASFGWSVAISGDGTRALIGAYAASDSVDRGGAAYVFVRGPEGWTREHRLSPNRLTSGVRFGRSVALDLDGCRAAVATHQGGSAFVFSRVSEGWREEATLSVTASSAETDGAIAISADGTRLVVGARLAAPPDGANAAGVAKVFVRRGATWTEEHAVFGESGQEWLGSAVGMSADGSRIVLGGRHVRVLARESASWREEARLYSQSPVLDLFGASVAISRDGSRIVVGARLANERNGAAYVYVRDGSAWALESTLIQPQAQGDELGVSVSFDASASVALIGSPHLMLSRGGAHFFVRHDHTWTHAGSFIGTPETMGSGLGTAAVLAGDASFALVGAYGDEEVGEPRNVGTVREIRLSAQP